MQVTKHSALRYAQRVMGLEEIEELTQQQLSAIKQKIFDVVVPKKHLVQAIGACEMRIGEHVWCFWNGALVTIKKLETPTDREFKGGRINSGCKLKKRKKKMSKWDRLENENVE